MGFKLHLIVAASENMGIGKNGDLPWRLRTSLDKLEKVSQTDIACVWSTQKKEAQEKYKAVPLYEMPCFEDKTEEVLVDANISKKIYSNLLSAMPVSSAALHKKEMAYFTKMTTTTQDPNRKNVVIMGRRTWDCIPPKFKPLPNRINFVLSRSDLKLDQYPDTFSFKNMQEVVEKLENKGFQNSFEGVWVIGGASLYKDALSSPYFGRLYLTKIHKEVDCDTFLPALPDNLKKVSDPQVSEEIQEEGGIQYSYHIYEK